MGGREAGLRGRPPAPELGQWGRLPVRLSQWRGGGGSGDARARVGGRYPAPVPGPGRARRLGAGLVAVLQPPEPEPEPQLWPEPELEHQQLGSPAQGSRLREAQRDGGSAGGRPGPEQPPARRGPGACRAWTRSRRRTSCRPAGPRGGPGAAHPWSPGPSLGAAALGTQPRAKVKASQQGRSSEWDIHRGTALLCSLDTWVPAALGPLASASCNLSCQVPQGWAGAQGLSCPWWHVGGEGKPLSCDGGGTLHWGHHRHLLQWCCCPLTSAALYHCVPGLPGAPSVYRC
ncbi:uncharacterized protein [Petaurus breviceps papuanus]|uniref:uncharacterized protein n=1 Tax=Petaurus breviceps papuanus TaxID=3040969 RepID=UPI0036DD8546